MKACVSTDIQRSWTVLSRNHVFPLFFPLRNPFGAGSAPCMVRPMSLPGTAYGLLGWLSLAQASQVVITYKHPIPNPCLWWSTTLIHNNNMRTKISLQGSEPPWLLQESVHWRNCTELEKVSMVLSCWSCIVKVRWCHDSGNGLLSFIIYDRHTVFAFFFFVKHILLPVLLSKIL